MVRILWDLMADCSWWCWWWLMIVSAKVITVPSSISHLSCSIQVECPRSTIRDGGWWIVDGDHSQLTTQNAALSLNIASFQSLQMCDDMIWCVAMWCYVDFDTVLLDWFDSWLILFYRSVYLFQSFLDADYCSPIINTVIKCHVGSHVSYRHYSH